MSEHSSTSFVRRCRRVNLGTLNRIRGQQVDKVENPLRGLLILRHGSNQLPSTKAAEGVEKSCLRRRRLRGLRKGKSRSRGGKPRRTHPPPALETKRRSTWRAEVSILFSKWRYSFEKRIYRHPKETSWFSQPGRQPTGLYRSMRDQWTLVVKRYAKIRQLADDILSFSQLLKETLGFSLVKPRLAQDGLIDHLREMLLSGEINPQTFDYDLLGSAPEWGQPKPSLPNKRTGKVRVPHFNRTVFASCPASESKNESVESKEPSSEAPSGSKSSEKTPMLHLPGSCACAGRPESGSGRCDKCMKQRYLGVPFKRRCKCVCPVCGRFYFGFGYPKG